MKKNYKLLIVCTIISMISFSSFILSPKQNNIIPEKYQTMENPFKGKGIEKGKSIYNQHCKNCHNAKGEAGTTVAKTMKFDRKLYGKPFSDQSDGAIYYQAIIGKIHTPNFEIKIKEEADRWAVVNYIRTFTRK